MSETEEETTQTTRPKVSLGETLKGLREERGLTVADIATGLHLEPRIIEHLESDNFEELPAAIFVRGYIRNYAKLLDVDAEDLIRIYDESGQEEEPEIIPEVKQPSQTSSSDKPVKAFTYLISLLLVIMVIAWWQSGSLITDRGDEAEPEQRTKVAPAFDYPFSVVEHPDRPYYESPAPQQEEAAAAAPEPAETAAPGPAGGEVITRGSGPDELVLSLSADSWIEVTDADGEQVYVSLGRAGDTLILRGQAPFAVLLGFAQGVEIEFNGEEFDPASYSRSGVARFTLGE